MAKMTWEYLAGFFDGEGTIRFTNNNACHWSIAQAHPRGRAILEEIQTFLREQGIPTGIHARQRKDGMYTLWISKRASVEQIGRATLPYLRIKKVEVQDVLRYLQLFPLLAQHPAWSMLMREQRQAYFRRRSTTSPERLDPAKPS